MFFKTYLKINLMGMSVRVVQMTETGVFMSSRWRRSRTTVGLRVYIVSSYIWLAQITWLWLKCHWLWDGSMSSHVRVSVRGTRLSAAAATAGAAGRVSRRGNSQTAHDAGLSSSASEAEDDEHDTVAELPTSMLSRLRWIHARSRITPPANVYAFSVQRITASRAY